MRKESLKYFSLFFIAQYKDIYVIFDSNMGKTLKKPKRGRPAGSDKEPMNIYVRSDRAQRLREFAIKEQKTISIVVENALERSYGI